MAWISVNNSIRELHGEEKEEILDKILNQLQKKFEIYDVENNEEPNINYDEMLEYFNQEYQEAINYYPNF